MEQAGYVGRRRSRRDQARQVDGPEELLHGTREPQPAEHARYADDGEYPDHGDGDGDGQGVGVGFGEHDADHIYGDREVYRSPAKRRRGALIAGVSAVLVLILAVGGFIVIRDVVSRLGGGGTEDYSGSGGEPVNIVIPAGATTTDIAGILADADVVASADAFLDAAAGNAQVTNIQPGTYALKAQMSGDSALAMLLDPSARNVVKIVIPEGYRIDQVVAAVADALKLDRGAVAATAADLSQLNLPAGFEGATSAEGMFFPATYDFAPGTSAQIALQAMTAKFAAVTAQTGFVAKARALGVAPYEALKVASMAEAEATNFADWSKVARVIYNRVAQGEPLGIDSTSVYEARLQGRDPMSIDYEVPTPYNTRRNPGFPPTPIGNPGEESLRAAVEPAAGNWLYYVQTDAGGSLSFTNDFSQFSGWAQECIEHSWGNC